MPNDHIKENPFSSDAPKNSDKPGSDRPDPLSLRIGYGTPTSDLTPKPGDNSRNGDQALPANVLPPLDISGQARDQSPKPSADRPTQASRLSDDQASSPLVLDAAYKQFLAATEGARKPMAKEDFDKMSPIWEKALEANSSIKPEQLAAFEYQALSAYGSQMICALAMDKSGKKAAAELKPDDFQKVSKDELQKAMSQAEVNWVAIGAMEQRALSALKPEEKVKYAEAGKVLETKMVQVQADATRVRDEALKTAGGDVDKQRAALSTFQTTIESAYLPAIQNMLDAQKALSPDLARAIDLRAAFLSDPKGIFAVFVRCYPW